jgi:carboxypeptidase Q
LTARLIASACLVAHGVLSAQPPAAPDERLLTRIRDEAEARSEVMDLARELTDIYGPRLTGSPHLKAAGTIVLQRLKQWGIESARLERWGPFGPGWTTDRFVALAVSPAAFPLQAYPKAWTPGTSGDVVAEAVLAPIASEQEFDAYRGKLRGRFVLTSRPGDGLKAMPLEFTRRRMAFFVDEGVAALVEPGGTGGAVVVTDGRLRDDAAFGGNGFYPWPDPVAAQVVVATEQYNRIARMLEAAIPVTLEMNIANTYHTAEPDSFNIIAEIPGTTRRDEVVIVGAHFDSWHAGTGAADNAAGCAAALEALRILKALRLEMRRTVRLALWTGSEQGLLGSRAYVAGHFADPTSMALKPEHARLSAYVNLDGGRGAIRGIEVQGNEAAARTLEPWLAALSQRGMTTLSLATSKAGDHAAFDAVGLPAFDLIQEPLDLETTKHSSADTFDRLGRADLVRNASIVASLLYYLADRDELMPRKPVPKPDPKAAGPWSPGR